MSGHGKSHPRNEYFAWLSHKVRQPMNSVVEAINHLLAMDLPDFQRDYIQALGRSTHDLVMIINDVLDTVRIDEGNFYLAEMPFDVRSAVEGVIEDLGSDVVERGLEMQCLIHPDMPAMLRGDPGRLRQALADMIRIALALSPVSDLFVDVTIQTENSEKAIIRFGVGTSVSQISALMASTHRVEIAPTTSASPTDMGAAIMRVWAYWRSNSTSQPRRPDPDDVSCSLVLRICEAIRRFWPAVFGSGPRPRSIISAVTSLIRYATAEFTSIFNW